MKFKLEDIHYNVEDLTVVFLHGFSTDSLLSVFIVYFMIHCLLFTSALGLDDTVGNFEVSKC